LNNPITALLLLSSSISLMKKKPGLLNHSLLSGRHRIFRYLKKYTVNEKKMIRYADRRGKEKVFTNIS